MHSITEILSDTKHRPYAIPNGPWIYYQEWNQAIFLHWKVDESLLKTLVPSSLQIDTFDGNAYISLVAFTMQQIRPRYLPAINFVSDFHEINLRTYVYHGDKKGVYFLNIEAAKSLSVFIAKALSGLPYEKADIARSENRYQSVNSKKQFELDCSYTAGAAVLSKTAIDLWLTERYALYLDTDKALYRYDIHHKEWEIKPVELQVKTLQYSIGKFSLSPRPDITHYSPGVQVLAWSRTGL